MFPIGTLFTVRFWPDSQTRIVGKDVCGLFSGLKITFMSLDQLEYQVLIETGLEKEKRNAVVIMRVRKYGFFFIVFSSSGKGCREYKQCNVAC